MEGLGLGKQVRDGRRRRLGGARILEEDLAALIIQLESEGVEVMPRIYALSAPHVFGIVQRIVRDPARSARVVRRVYTWLWESRAALARQPVAALDLLRSEAHRYAIEESLAGDSAREVSRETDPLKALYLDLSPVGGEAPDPRQTLLRLMERKTEGRSQ